MSQKVILQKNDSRPIGIFDSGVGGLTVVKELIKSLPFEDIVYYGDTARVPYGTKSRNTIIRFSIENALFLLKQKVKLIIVACNTSSSVALAALRKNFKIPIVGVIEPGAQDAVNSCRNEKIGVIGTTATIKSNAYSRQIMRVNPRIKVFSRNCPLFVPIVEDYSGGAEIILDIIRYYLEPIKKKRVDTLVLGCTHYPLLKEYIAKFMGKEVSLVDSAKSTAVYVRDLLYKSGALNNASKKGMLKFFVSDEISNFRRIGERFLGKKIKSIRKAGYGL
jgi:glutamate racemase